MNFKLRLKNKMIPATFFTSGPYLKNKQFDVSDPLLNRDDCLRGFFLLKKAFERRGINLSTQDINALENSAFVLFNDMPHPRQIAQGKKNYLILMESPLIRPDNWNIKRHLIFDKIFTWNDDFVDNKKYFKINYPNAMSVPSDGGVVRKEKFCVMISNNKYVRSPVELYSHRVKAIRWFEKKHPEDFDLYGGGWDGQMSFREITKTLLCFAPERLFQKPFPSYRGRVDSKNATLQKYKFSICYENIRDAPGYISEKIIDCFLAGCVPVYWGAPNITDHIPAETFIDFRKFMDYDKLYAYLRGISESEYAGYLDAIKNFIVSKQGQAFSFESFAENVSSPILEDLKN